VKHGRAVIHRESDAGYTLIIFQRVDDGDDEIQSATANLTLATAFNTARDTLAAMATGGESHRIVTISTKIV